MLDELCKSSRTVVDLAWNLLTLSKHLIDEFVNYAYKFRCDFVLHRQRRDNSHVARLTHDASSAQHSTSLILNLFKAKQLATKLMIRHVTYLYNMYYTFQDLNSK